MKMNYTPQLVCQSFAMIPFEELYLKGFRVILTDLDNTLSPYTDHFPSAELKKQIALVKDLGFQIYLVSNNHSQRITTFEAALGLDGALCKSHKPSPKRIEAFLKEKGINKKEVIAVGDQLVTDILAYNRADLYSIFVKTIDYQTQKWYTKINRLREKRIIKKMGKENPQIQREILEL